MEQLCKTCENNYHYSEDSETQLGANEGRFILFISAISALLPKSHLRQTKIAFTFPRRWAPPSSLPQQHAITGVYKVDWNKARAQNWMASTFFAFLATDVRALQSLQQFVTCLTPRIVLRTTMLNQHHFIAILTTSSQSHTITTKTAS